MGGNSFRKFLLYVSVPAFALALLTTGLMKAQNQESMQAKDHYVQDNLVSNGYIKARITDSNLVNPWGIANGPTTPIWIANQGTSTSTLYKSDGVKRGEGSPFVVNIPTTNSGMQGPTGIVFNPDQANHGFSIKGPNDTMVSPIYLFDDLNGTISGWSPKSVGGSTNAVIAVTTPHAMYKGLAVGVMDNAWYLYAADAMPIKDNKNRYDGGGGIQVFNSSFTDFTNSSAFVDPVLSTLSLPSGDAWTTFNVENVGGRIFVTYAPIPSTGGHPILTSNAGVVAEFNPNGTFVRNVIVSAWHAGPLDDPWALVMAPKNFGELGDDLLVGNFGSGEILAYKPTASGTYTFEEVMDGTNNEPVKLGRLWDLSFGNGAYGTTANTLYVTTGGPNPKADGLFAAFKSSPWPDK